MKIITHTFDQYTDEWWTKHAGIMSSSKFKKIVAPTTLKQSASRDAYLFEIAAEWRRIQRGGEPSKGGEGYVNHRIQWGIDHEPEARVAYAQYKGLEVQEVGLIEIDGLPAGCSPDGLIGTDGGLEIKCPGKGTHARSLYEQKLPTEYIPQVQGSLWITGREWWDFFSYYPGLLSVVIRVYPDRNFHRALDREINEAAIKLEHIKQTLIQREGLIT